LLQQKPRQTEAAMTYVHWSAES